MKLKSFNYLFLLLGPALAVAQRPADPAPADNAPILWEFDTVG